MRSAARGRQQRALRREVGDVINITGVDDDALLIARGLVVPLMRGVCARLHRAAAGRFNGRRDLKQCPPDARGATMSILCPCLPVSLRTFSQEVTSERAAAIKRVPTVSATVGARTMSSRTTIRIAHMISTLQG